MSDYLKSKSTSVGFAEVRQNGTTYELWLNGVLKTWSGDLDYVMREFEKIY